MSIELLQHRKLYFVIIRNDESSWRLFFLKKKILFELVLTSPTTQMVGVSPSTPRSAVSCLRWECACADAFLLASFSVCLHVELAHGCHACICLTGMCVQCVCIRVWLCAPAAPGKCQGLKWRFEKGDGGLRHGRRARGLTHKCREGGGGAEGPDKGSSMGRMWTHRHHIQKVYWGSLNV